MTYEDAVLDGLEQCKSVIASEEQTAISMVQSYIDTPMDFETSAILALKISEQWAQVARCAITGASLEIVTEMANREEVTAH